jgi:hypothetical protein
LFVLTFWPARAAAVPGFVRKAAEQADAHAGG